MIGKEILNYIITSKIGSGGMGSVFLAEHKFIKQQKVAIKMIKSEVFNDFAKSRLKEEAERLASLDHPNIVKFLNYDIDAQGNVYLIMEYAEGVTLDQYINAKTGLIVEEKILPLFEPILDAFEYAHKKKVVHRDIKPANIIITTEGVPKILDFGISTIVDDADNTDREEALIMGTPSYMSPEQVKGRGIDTRSDIYSLGVLLHQMLTGNAPYDTTTLSEQDINEKIVMEPLPRMKAYYHYISDKLQDIVDKATAKEPKERYQTCAEFKKALRKVLVKEPVSKWLKLSVAVILIFILGGGVYVWDCNRVKIRYYKDYVEQWGVPQGIGKLSGNKQKHMHRMYRFEYRKGKLQRLSHVNSRGHIIEETESERYERPLDMRLYYSDNGKISYAKVYDRSGKVVYVKSYNDKLNAVVYQWDDEYRTEKILGAQTVGYVNALADDNQEKGKVSRWLIEYDVRGYVLSIRYAGFQNIRVGDSHNIYGRGYVRDHKGRVTEEHYLGYDGSLKATKWGMGIKKFYYDDNDNWVKAEYLTVNGEPALDDYDGIYIYTMEYDKYGNVLQAFHRNSDGALMSPKKHGIASVKYVYDNDGMIVETNYLDIEGQPCFNTDNVSKIVEAYDENGYVKHRVFYDTEGNPCLAKPGFASVTYSNDERGNQIEMWYYGLNGEFIVSSEGVAGIKCRYDSVGNEIEQVYYGIDSKPCLLNGIAGCRREYDERNMVTKVTYLNAQLEPAAGYDNIGIVRIEYDKRGNRTKVAYFDATDSHLVVSDELIAGWVSVYDDNGYEIECSYFNDKNKPCTYSNGCAKRTYTYDKAGNEIAYRYFDMEGKLVLVDGIAGRNYKYDERGNVIEDMPVGVDGQLALDRLILRKKYDNLDNVIEESVYDRNNKLVKNSLNIHKYVYEYNNRNQCMEERYYGTDGKLIYCRDGYAIVKNEYDGKGNCIKTYYFGIDKQPICCNEGWASCIRKFDVAGNVVIQSFFGIDGKLTDPSVKVPVEHMKYDKWGNEIYLASTDENGYLIFNPKTGYSVMRRECDSKGNVLVETYYDRGDEPISCKDGYHKVVSDYNERGKLIRLSYWDKKCYPTDCAAGWHKGECTYNDSGTPVACKYYNKSNRLLLTMLWDGNDWVREIDWKPMIQNWNRECPMSLDDGLSLMSAKVTGNYSCRFTFKISYSKYELNSKDLETYKTRIAIFVAKCKREELMPSNVTITGILYDSKNRKLYEVSK